MREGAESLADIDETLNRIVAAATRGIPRLDARRIDGGGGATRIRARLDGAEVKIETSPVTRGVVHDPEKFRRRPSGLHSMKPAARLPEPDRQYSPSSAVTVQRPPGRSLC